MRDQKIVYVFKCEAISDGDIEIDDGGQGRSMAFPFDYGLSITISSYIDVPELDVDLSEDELYKLHYRFNNLIGRNLRITIETEP